MGLAKRITEMIKAIETEYKGYRFRSRLEARWAVFFDACNAKWEYEPEGFELDNGQWYLPDFLLHDVKGRASGDLWVEVKGVMTQEDAIKIYSFCGKDANGNGIVKNPIYIVAGIPEEKSYGGVDRFCSDWGYQGFPGVKRGPYPFNFETIDGDYFVAHPGINLDGNFELFGDDSNYLSARDYETTINAFRKARQARFEHGETPVVSVPQPTNVYHCPTKEERAKMALKFAMTYQTYDVSMGGDKNLNHLPDIKELYYPFLAKQGIEKPDWYGGTTEIQTFFREKKEKIMGEILEHDPYITEDEMLAKTHFSKTMIHKFLLKRRGI